MAILQHIGRGPKDQIAAALAAGKLVIGDLVVTNGANGNELVLLERDGSQVVITSRTQAEFDLLGTTVPAGSDIEAVLDILADVIGSTNAVIGEVTEGKTVVQMIADAEAAAKTAATEGDDAVKELVQANADAIGAVEESIGDVADGKTVVQMIADAEAAAKAAAVEGDNAVKELVQANADAIAAHKELVDGVVTTLVGTDTGKSVRTIANEELAAQLLSGNADADFKTLQELAAWLEDHPEDVAEINLNISNLQKLVGELPEGVTATDVVGYIAEAVAAEKARAEEVEGGLDERVTALEGLVGEGGSVDEKIEAAKTAAVTAANGYTDEKIAAEVTAREKGDTDTLAAAKAYTDEKVAAEATARGEAITAEATARQTGDADTLAAAKAYADEKAASAITWVDFGA